MRVLWIYAHPEPLSLNGSLRDEGVATLRGLGHEVRQSDLYAMDWRAAVTDADFPDREPGRLRVGVRQEAGYHAGTLTADVRAEQEKVRWADTLVVQFPLWWFGMPAILKGWFDRVFTQGFAFGLHDPVSGRQRRYGDAALAGRRALTITSFGAREASMGPRGIHGDVEQLLFPLLHGIFWYTGIEALPPFTVAGADRCTEADGDLAAKRLRERLRGLADEAALPYRHQERGDYDTDLVLRADLAPGRTGLDVHRTDGPRLQSPGGDLGDDTTARRGPGALRVGDRGLGQARRVRHRLR